LKHENIGPGTRCQ